jgi:excinuclease ABC subunit B
VDERRPPLPYAFPKEGEFHLVSDFPPKGDQPAAIEKLIDGLARGDRFQTLLGVTGSGKTFAMANIIAAVQRPTLIIAHNKTLAAQLTSELRSFFPDNHVEYFVSYYDYYQPEAYIPQTDTYIEKDCDINEEIDRLRHSATESLLTRRDVIVVASVSCIYGLGSPEDYEKLALHISPGFAIGRDKLIRRLVDMQYMRNNYELVRGTFRVRGDIFEVYSADKEMITRMEFAGDAIESVTEVDPTTGHVKARPLHTYIFPASHYVLLPEKHEMALASIKAELDQELPKLLAANKLIEYQRLKERVTYDLEMLREVGFCRGIENYSRHFTGKLPGETPSNLIDYFPDDFLMIVDESHVTLPQLHGMYNGDRSRKETLVEYGFRLPSALDNRPLRFEEWETYANQVIFTTATPGPYELKNSAQVVEQIIRPTGLVDPKITLRPSANQIDHLVAEINARTQRHERTLVTTLTKRMAENLADYLTGLGMKVQYLHSDVDTIERIRILKDLRLGTYDVVVGINLLREGLDLPEVSLIGILDADKEGFLRSDKSLIQIIGRAARNVNGEVVLYADKMTDSMKRAIDETNRRREKQLAYNAEHGITPQTIVKAIRDITDQLADANLKVIKKAQTLSRPGAKLTIEELTITIADLELQMEQFAELLEFERAAAIRDQVRDLKRELDRKLRERGQFEMAKRVR